MSQVGLNDLLVQAGMGRNKANEERWQPVIEHGFKSMGNPDGITGGRLQNNPGFVGDGALRFEAVSRIDFSRASAVDLLELIDTALRYLDDRIPDSYSALPPVL